MRQTLHRRLKELEVANARRTSWVDEERKRQKDLEAARRRVELFLKMRGIKQEGSESLVETWARALEIPCRELVDLLRSGVDPIHKYLEENGVFEELKRRRLMPA